MDETLHCPGCHAQLMLPHVPAGQAVQCPRCQRVFEPNPRPSHSAVTTVGPTSNAGDGREAEDHDLFEQPRRIRPLGSLWGGWFALVAMLALAANLPAFVLNSYASFVFATLLDQERELRSLERRLGARHPEVLALNAEVNGQHNRWLRAHHRAWEWIGLTSWPAVLAIVIWMFLASRNVMLLQSRGTFYTPVWIFFLFCVPLVNVFVAYMNLQELWKSSDPRAIDDLESWRNAPASWLVRWVGLNYACSALLVFILDAASPDNRFVRASLTGIANTNLVIGGALLIAAIRYITVRQRERYIRLYEDPA